MDTIKTANTLDINLRADGVYLSIIRPLGASPVRRGDIDKLIESYGVADVDLVAVNNAYESNAPEVEVKISSQTSIFQVNESATIEVTLDAMQAYITFVPPVNKGLTLSTEDIRAVIDKQGVKPDPKLLDDILAERKYERRLLIARGQEPIEGKDGTLKFHFDRSNLKPKPKIMEDGTVNFKQLDMFRLCRRGDVLVTSIAPVEGKDGLNVYGQIVSAPKVKLAAPIPKGSGTVISDDELHLIAEIDGQLLLQEGKINISPHLEIEGNVDNSTGNIDFNGEVTIKGNVITGFKVKAVGNIDVFGVCEGATLISETGSIILGNGAQGSDKGELHAAQDVTAKFIESCKVTAGGNIMADSILKSTVKCDGSILLAGKNGLLVGGSLVAGDKLVARTIGSPMGTLTEIEVGGNPKELTRHKELLAEYDTLRTEYDKCDKAVGTLNLMKQRNQLTDDKKAMLVKMINMKMLYRSKMTKMQDEIDELARTLAVNVGTVAAANVIRPGVRITIGNAQMNVRDEIANCKVRNDGTKISIGPNI